MRNAELSGPDWLDPPHARFDLRTAIPHSTFRIPHCAGSPSGRPRRWPWSARVPVWSASCCDG